MSLKVSATGPLDQHSGRSSSTSDRWAIPHILGTQLQICICLHCQLAEQDQTAAMRFLTRTFRSVTFSMFALGNATFACGRVLSRIQSHGGVTQKQGGPFPPLSPFPSPHPLPSLPSRTLPSP